jgi:hypothetical protein
MGCFSSKTADHGPIRPQAVQEASGLSKNIKINEENDVGESSRVHTVGPSNLTDKAGDDSGIYVAGLKDSSKNIEDFKEVERIVQLWLNDIYAEGKTRILPKV